MYKTIFLPLDGSEFSESAIPLAQELARLNSAVIELVLTVPERYEDLLPKDLLSAAEQDAETYLQRVAAKFPKELAPRYAVKQGDPAEVIVDTAGSQPEALIIMATHGYRGMKRLMLGSVAQKVVQAATVPVLLLPGHAKLPEAGAIAFERVIVPLDGSPTAECILDKVVPLCRLLNMELIVVRVFNPHFPGASIRMHEISQIVHDAAENYVKKVALDLKASGLEKVSYKTLRGNPAEQITDFAIQTKNSLTAMCTHGRHDVGRWVLGSVTDAVVHYSEEPVLVIRAGESCS